MLNILVPCMGQDQFFKNSLYPKLLNEVNGKPIIERVVANLGCIKNSRLIFVLSQEECSTFHIDSVINVLLENSATVIKLRNPTRGALCTCLMAIDEINTCEPLIIVNSDQIIDCDYNEVVDYFKESKTDAGVIGFHSVHPRWSYYHETDGLIDEVAEKRPLSRNAIAGFYWFNKGEEFIQSAFRVLLQSPMLEKYYISSVLNDFIINSRKVIPFKIDACRYHSFYSPEKIKQYERG